MPVSFHLVVSSSLIFLCIYALFLHVCFRDLSLSSDFAVSMLLFRFIFFCMLLCVFLLFSTFSIDFFFLIYYILSVFFFGIVISVIFIYCYLLLRYTVLL